MLSVIRPLVRGAALGFVAVLFAASSALAQSAPRIQTPGPDAALGAAEAFRDLPAAVAAGVGWERLVFSWQDIQETGPESWKNGYFSDEDLRRQLDAGIQVVGLLQDTPAWARAHPGDDAASVPTGLGLPWNDPANAWGQFVYRMAKVYRGRIDRWIVWNEPEFRPSDQGGLYYTWAGDEADYYRLLKVAYQAARAANPDARVVFAATSYWIDRVNGRRQFLDRLLDVAQRDPAFARNGGFFDAVGLNIYWSPDDVRRVADDFRSILRTHGLTKPLWITEINCMPFDDPLQPLPNDGVRVTLDQQSSFVVQAFATALASGYQRVGWYAMIDRDPWDEAWGLTRKDGTLRPAYDAFRAVTTWLGGAHDAQWLPIERPPSRRTASYATVDIYRVVLNRPGGQRVTVLWNGTGSDMAVAVPPSGERGRLVRKWGAVAGLASVDGSWQLTLPAATKHAPTDAPGYYFTGGDPLILVEDGVPAGAKVPQLQAQAARAW